MTVNEAIALVDELKPNQIEEARKIEWLSRLDQWVFDQVITPREKDESTPRSFEPYAPAFTEEEPEEGACCRELLVKAPFDEMYRFYLEMQIDLANMEMDQYNNSSALYQNARGQFLRDYNRRHRRMDTRCAHHKF